MPVELADKPATISPDKSSLNTKVLGREINRGKVIEDEFNNDDITPLEPLTDNYLDSEYARGLDESLREDFKYYSRTRKLEVGTERTAVIQDVLDKLTAGTNTKTRAVIMNKGRDGAFVTPDGTVFVSQSMINRLSTLDELAAVLAHEVGHLIFETSKKQLNTPYHTGTGWVHESACDTIAPALLEQTGFNSRAFSRAILKVSGFERGVIHQGGLTRASESETTHLLIDRRTSDQEEVPIPPSLIPLRKWERERTNVEIVNHMIYENLEDLGLDLDDLKSPWWIPFKLAEHADTKISVLLNDFNTSLERLHPRDLKQIYDNLLERRHTKGAYRLLDVCNSLISSRLKESGYSDNEIKLFLLLEENPDNPHRLRSENVEESRFFKAKGDIKELADVLAALAEDDTKLVRMSHEVFDKPDNKLGDQYKSIATFLNLLDKFLYDENYESKSLGLGIPCDRETLLDTLATISKMNSNDTNPDRQQEVKGWVTTVLNRYITKTYFQFLDERGLTFDDEYIKEFFMEVKSRGIVIDPDYLTRSIEGTDYSYVIKKQVQKGNIDVVISSIREVFGEFVLSEENINSGLNFEVSYRATKAAAYQRGRAA